MPDGRNECGTGERSYSIGCSVGSFKTLAICLRAGKRMVSLPWGLCWICLSQPKRFRAARPLLGGWVAEGCLSRWTVWRTSLPPSFASVFGPAELPAAAAARPATGLADIQALGPDGFPISPSKRPCAFVASAGTDSGSNRVFPLRLGTLLDYYRYSL